MCDVTHSYLVDQKIELNSYLKVDLDCSFLLNNQDIFEDYVFTTNVDNDLHLMKQINIRDISTWIRNKTGCDELECSHWNFPTHVWADS